MLLRKCQTESNGVNSGEETYCISIMTIFQTTRLNVNSGNCECALRGNGVTSLQA